MSRPNGAILVIVSTTIVRFASANAAGGAPDALFPAAHPDACSGWSHDLEVREGTLPNILPTHDGGVIVVSRGDVRIDSGPTTAFGRPAGAFVANFSACGAVRYVVPLLMPHSLVEAESLDPSGDLYLTGTSWEGSRRQYVWTARMEAGTGRLGWFRQYPCVDSGFSSLYSTGKGGLIAIAEISGGLRIGNRTLGVPPELVDYSFTPAMQFLIVLDEQGQLAFSEELDNRRHVLYPGRDQVFLASQRDRASDYAESVEARAYDGRLLWRRTVDRDGYLVADGNGGLVQLAYGSYRCHDPQSPCPPTRMEKVSFGPDGQVSPGIAISPYGEEATPAAAVQHWEARRSEVPVQERTPESPIWSVDSSGRSLVLNGEAGFTAYDGGGRIIRQAPCCAREAADKSSLGTTLAWAFDGAVLAAHMAERGSVLRLTKQFLDQKGQAAAVQPGIENGSPKQRTRSADKAVSTGGTCPAGMVRIPPWLLPLPRIRSASARFALHAYCIDILETTQAEYRTCVKAHKCAPIEHRLSWPNRDSYPVTSATILQANDYCRFRGKRLPTPGEWRRAAFGDPGVADSWGDPSFFIGGPGVCHGKRPCEVGTSDIDISSFGARDMISNAQEWLCDESEIRDCHEVGGNRWDSDPREGAVVYGYAKRAGIRCAADLQE